VNNPAGVELIRNGRVIVARMPIEVEISQAPLLRGPLMQAVENRDLGLVVDMTATEYLDSSGVNMLFELGESLAARQLRMAVVMPQGGTGRAGGVHRRSRLCHADPPRLGERRRRDSQYAGRAVRLDCGDRAPGRRKKEAQP
jgi:anti-anti-sigma factor